MNLIIKSKGLKRSYYRQTIFFTELISFPAFSKVCCCIILSYYHNNKYIIISHLTRRETDVSGICSFEKPSIKAQERNHIESILLILFDLSIYVV